MQNFIDLVFADTAVGEYSKTTIMIMKFVHMYGYVF